MAEETGLAKINRISKCKLTKAVHLRELLVVPEFVEGMGRFFPGTELTPQERRTKAEKLICEAVIHVENSKAKEKIEGCLASTVIESIQACGSLDLSLNTALGEAYLIPFKYTCTLMPGYRGFIRLIANTGAVSNIESILVYEGEKFDWSRDERGAKWVHEPDLHLQGNDSKVVGCYAVGYPTQAGAPPWFEVMNKEQLEKIRKASKAKDSPAYKFWLTEMYRKAPIRRLRKFVPRTDGQAWDLLTKAEELDNRDFGVIDVEARAILDEHSKQLRGQAEQALLPPPAERDATSPPELAETPAAEPSAPDPEEAPPWE